MSAGRVDIPGSAPKHSGSTPRTPLSPDTSLSVSVILARADAADAELVADFAANFGLRVTESSPEKRTVKLSGSAADFDRAFQTQLAHFGDYVTYQGPLSVPDKLDGKILAVLGLDNRPVAHPH